MPEFDVDNLLNNGGADPNPLDNEGKELKTPNPADDTSADNADDNNNDNANDTPEPSWFTDVVTKFGVTLDANANFEETTEGVTGLVEAISSKLVDEKVKAILNTNPIVGEFASFINNGGKAEDYFKVSQSSWSDVILKEEDKATQAKIVNDTLARNGLSSALIDATIASLSKDNKLFETANQQLNSLKDAEIRNKQALLQEQEIRQQEAVKKFDEYKNKVNSIIEKGELINDIKIAPKDKETFKAAFLSAGENSIDAIYSKMTDEEQIAVALFIFNKCKIEGVANKGRELNLNNRRDRNTSGTGSGDIKTNGKTLALDINDSHLNNLLNP